MTLVVNINGEGVTQLRPRHALDYVEPRVEATVGRTRRSNLRNTCPTYGATAAARRANTNITRKREAREWDEQHGKLVDLSAFQRDILPLIQTSRSADSSVRPVSRFATCRSFGGARRLRTRDTGRHPNQLATRLVPALNSCGARTCLLDEEVRMKWVTRERPKTDRIACPWLIQNFIDKDAEFLYVPTDQVLEVAEREGAHSYDAPNAEYTHRDGLCSFEVLLEEYNLDDPALQLLARVVHGADVADDRDATPQSRGLLAVAEGFHLLNLGDHRQLELSLPVYDALYAWSKNEVAAQ
jgi:hypothetical protein